MALSETRVILMRDADMNIHVIREDNGLLYDYDIVAFFNLMAQPHLNLYIIADISESVIRDDSNTGPFGCETEQNLAIESWNRLLHFDEFILPHSPESAKVFLNDFNIIWGVAEREGLMLGE